MSSGERSMVKTVIMKSNGTIELQEQPYPSLEPGAVLIKTAYSEVCGTDVHLQKGQLAEIPYPIIPGHVSTGTIEELNGDIYDIDGVLLQEGDPITFLSLR